MRIHPAHENFSDRMYCAEGETAERRKGRATFGAGLRAEAEGIPAIFLPADKFSCTRILESSEANLAEVTREIQYPMQTSGPLKTLSQFRADWSLRPVAD